MECSFSFQLFLISNKYSLSSRISVWNLYLAVWNNSPPNIHKLEVTINCQLLNKSGNLLILPDVFCVELTNSYSTCFNFRKSEITNNRKFRYSILSTNCESTKLQIRKELDNSYFIFDNLANLPNFSTEYTKIFKF